MTMSKSIGPPIGPVKLLERDKRTTGEYDGIVQAEIFGENQAQAVGSEEDCRKVDLNVGEYAARKRAAYEGIRTKGNLRDEDRPGNAEAKSEAP